MATSPAPAPTGPAGPGVAAGPVTSFALLLLADGRLPAGSHVHSGGVESAVADGRIVGEDDLDAFVRGRLTTAGLQDAALASATCRRLGRAGPGGLVAELRQLDAEADARLPVGALRDASRRLGRQLVRVADRCWPSPLLAHVAGAHPAGLHQSVALGAACVAAGVGAHDAATLALHHVLMTCTQAGVRLLGLDPFAVAALTSSCAELVEELARCAAGLAAGPLEDLPAFTGPLAEIAAAGHAALPTRLFAT